MSHGRSIRATSFGAVADDYDRYRPGPPLAAVDWLLSEDDRPVLDLGAGTGALTRVLLERGGPPVVAGEPDDRMRKVLARRSPGAVVVGCRAEALPFGAGRFGGLLVSSAWHWMDPVATVAEAARILGPGGVLGVLWNGPDRSVAWVSAVLSVGRDGRPGPPADAGTRRAGGDSPDPAAAEPRPAGNGDADRRRLDLPPGAPFAAPEHTVIHWTYPMARGDLPALASTYSRVITRPDRERAAVLAEVARIAATRPELANEDVVPLPMACRCWRARRR